MRRHRHADVLAHQLRRGRPVAALVRGDEALQEPLLVLAELGALGARAAAAARSASPGRAAARCWPTATLRSSISAVSAADHSSTSRRIEHRALARRQELDHGDVRQLDRLARDDDGVRLLLGRRDLVEQPVRVGLQPRDLALRRRGPPLASRAASPGTRWWRSCTATRAGLHRPRSSRAPSTRAGTRPAARPRPRRRSRASGSSGRAARAGAGRGRR